MSTPPSSHADSSDGPWIWDRGWERLTEQQKRAYYYAETGRVCIGPVGAPVTGVDRLILWVIQDEAPEVMENWFELSHSSQFYSTKLKIVADATEEQGPRYALYRSLVGPAILSTWSDVARHVIFVPGSLYQLCSSYQEASLRLAQALHIGGIVAKLPLNASLRPPTTAAWLQGFVVSDQLLVRIEEEDAPDLRGTPYCSADGVDEILDEDLVTGGWMTYLPGCRPERELPVGLLGSVQSLESAIHDRIPTGGDAEHLHTTASTSRRSTEAPGGVPIGVSHRHASAGVDAATEERGGSCEAGTGGYFAVIQGQSPWVFADRADIREGWLPPGGTDQVGHYLTLREALEAFRTGLRSGQIHS